MMTILHLRSGACSLVMMVWDLGPGACFAFRYYQHLPQWPV